MTPVTFDIFLTCVRDGDAYQAYLNIYKSTYVAACKQDKGQLYKPPSGSGNLCVSEDGKKILYTVDNDDKPSEWSRDS